MKIIVAAAALAFALPAAAQAAPADHAQHQSHAQGQNAPAAHAGHAEDKPSEKHKHCDMNEEECRKRCAEMHGKHEARDGGHAGQKPKG